MTSRPLRLILLLITLSLLCSCGTVPEELPAAHTLQGEALVKIAQGREAVIHAYDAELRLAYAKHLDAIERYELQKAATNGAVPVETAQRIATQKAEQIAKINAQLDIKKNEFLNDHNVELAMRLHATVDRWMQVYVTDFALRVQELIREGKGLFDSEPVTPAPSTEDS